MLEGPSWGLSVLEVNASFDNRGSGRRRMNSPWMKDTRTLLPVCKSGCPAVLFRKFWNSALRYSITSSSKFFLPQTFPGRDPIVTRADSRSRMSRKCTKSVYRRLTMDLSSLKVGMFVLQMMV